MLVDHRALGTVRCQSQRRSLQSKLDIEQPAGLHHNQVMPNLILFSFLSITHDSEQCQFCMTSGFRMPAETGARADRMPPGAADQIIQTEKRYGPVLIAQDTLTLTDSVSSPTATGAAAARPVAIRR